MASTLIVTYEDLQKAVGHHLGYTRTISAWDAEQKDDVKDCIKNGLRMFYHPPPLEKGKEPHRWSFLRPVATLSLTNGDYDYDLPANFVRLMEPFTHAASVDNPEIALISDREIRDLQARDPQTDTPQYAAIRPKAATGSAVQGFEAIFYPTPDTSYTVSYRAELMPDMLTDANDNPLGGAQHSGTIMEACLMAAEQYHEDQENIRQEHKERFMTLLAASIAVDSESHVVAYPVRTVPDTLHVTYETLLEQVGVALGHGPDWHALSHADRRQVDFVIQAGLRMFYNPPPLKGERSAHQWRFLAPKTTLTTVVDDYDYDLPSDFGGLVGELIYQDANSFYQRVTLIGPGDLEIMKNNSGSTYTGHPEYGAVRPKTMDGTAEQGWELILFPTPDSTYTLLYRYHKLMLPLTSTRKYPYGSSEHGNTILLACLAQAEIHGPASDPRRPKMQAFMEALQASVQIDKQSTAPRLLGRESTRFERDIEDLNAYRIQSVSYTP